MATIMSLYIKFLYVRKCIVGLFIGKSSFPINTQNDSKIVITKNQNKN